MAAKDAKLSQISKTELAEAYSRLKGRISKQAANARSQNEKMISDAITVASGGGLGYYMGKMEQEAGGAAATEDALAEKQQLAGVDLDLLVGGVAAAVGLTGMGGKMSDAVRAVGVGALTEWAGRVGYDKGTQAQ
jgi:hypothetical protein